MKTRKIISIILVLFLTAIFFSGCGAMVDEQKVKRAVEKQGYSNVELYNKSIFFPDWNGCSDSDDAAYDGQATNPLGKRVDIIVCAGWPFKGVTVRTK